MEGTRPARPFGVSVLVILLWLQAVFGFIAGVILLIENNNSDVLAQTELSSGDITAVAIGILIISLITGWVASSIGRGSRFGRGVAAAVAILNLISGVFSLFAFSAHTRISALWSIVLAVVVLYILYGEKGSQEFFERGR